MRVWFSGKIAAFQAAVGGSIPLTRTHMFMFPKNPLWGFSFETLI